MEENKIPQEDLSEEDYAQSNPAFAKYLAWKRRMQERGKWNPADPAHQWRVNGRQNAVWFGLGSQPDAESDNGFGAYAAEEADDAIARKPSAEHFRKQIDRFKAEDRIVQATPPIARRLRTLYVELLVLRREAASTRAVLRQWSGLDRVEDSIDVDRPPAHLLAALAEVVADVHESLADIARLIGEEEDR